VAGDAEICSPPTIQRDSRQVARNVAICRESRAKQAKCGESGRHFWRHSNRHFWRHSNGGCAKCGESAANWLINGAWSSGDSSDLARLCRHMARVGGGGFATSGESEQGTVQRANFGADLASGHDVRHISCKITRRGAGSGADCRIYGAMRCRGQRRPAAERADRRRGCADFQRATLSRSGSRCTDEGPARADTGGNVEVWTLPAGADDCRPLIHILGAPALAVEPMPRPRFGVRQRSAGRQLRGWPDQRHRSGRWRVPRPAPGYDQQADHDSRTVGLIVGNGGAGGDRNKVAVANALNGAGHTDQQTKNKRQDAKSKQSDTHPRSAGLLTAGV